MSDAVEISAGSVHARVNFFGAELASLTRDGNEYLWQADKRWWGSHAPILFPIVGSIRHDSAQSAAGPVHMPRHGIVRKRNFTLYEQGEDFVCMEIASNNEMLEAFPYPFVLRIRYQLIASKLGGPIDTLQQNFTLTNTGDTVIPFSFGGHPAFNVPAPGHTGSWEDYSLAFEKPWTYVSPGVDAEGLWDYELKIPVVDNSDKLTLQRDLFRYDTFVLTDTPQNRVTLLDGADSPVLRLDFEGFPYVGVWSPGAELGDAPFVAIEPWTGTSTRTDEDDQLEHKQHSLFADPGETVKRTFTITLL